MARNMFLFVLVVGSVLLAGCGPSDSGNSGSTEVVAPVSTPIVDSDGGAVTEATTKLTEAVVSGPSCAYGLAISNDIAHRLNHYRICAPETGAEQKKADAYADALNDCFSLCDETYPETEDNIACTTQCKGE